MFNNKTLISVIALVVLLLLGLSLFFFFYNSEENKNNSQDVVEQEEKETKVDSSNRIPVDQEEGEEEDVPTPTNTSSVEAELDEQEDFGRVDLKNMASSFAERFGSYSNHSNFANIKDLKIFMTENMKEWAEGFVQEQSQEDSGEYSGITTKAISTDILNFNKEGGEAEVVVTTRRRESKGSRSDSTTYTQDLTLEFVKQNNSWKVGGAYWE